MPQKVWAQGEEVLATDFNTYVQNQVVPAFTDVGTRDSQWPSPPNGALSITLDTNTLWQRIGGGWRATSPITRSSPATTTAARIRAGSTSATTTAGGVVNIAMVPALGTTVLSTSFTPGGSYAFIAAPVLGTTNPGSANVQVTCYNPNGGVVNAQAVVVNWIVIDIP